MTRIHNAAATFLYFIRGMPGSIGVLVISLSLVPGVSPVQARDLKLSAGLSYEYNDNIFLQSANEQSETILHAMFSADYTRESAAHETSLRLVADHRDYQDDAYEDETVFSSSLSSVLNLTKQRIFWDILNIYDNVQTDRTTLDTPSSRENTNYFSTGPRFILLTNSKNMLSLGIKYEDTYYEISDVDFTGYRTDMQYERHISRTLLMRLSAAYGEREFDNDTLNENYARTDAFITLAKKFRTSSLEADVGQTYINPDTNPSSDENLYRLRYENQLGKRTRLELRYTQELSDFSTTFAAGSVGGDGLSDIRSELFLLKEAGLALIRSFPRSSLRMDVIYSDRDYSLDTLDTRDVLSRLSFTSEITSGLEMRLAGSYSDFRYTGGSRNDELTSWTAGIIKRLPPSFDMHVELNYRENDSTDTGFDWDERRIIAGGNYYFH